ncbi:hypothetical protein [Pedobacter punctiformis]|uniref:Uncharacterized protein n=1 Tax=Pedobacter punctiformis TaxID=3004097 RepID=A0ABT4L7C7_9SPHI|nr:hypothetical protein [Pedobacter sp. HCMS5-2]MCZ4243822.1 hypothetical protein [Pedobacter sp. HCMS5-2]
MKINPLLIVKLILVLFILVGLGLTFFMIRQEVKIIGAYLVSVLFFLIPSLVLYDLIFGFSISEKTIKKQTERQKSLSFDHDGILYKRPLFDITQLISWDSIETVIFRNYNSDDRAQYIFHLTKPPVQTLSENPWWLNRIFPTAIKNTNKILIDDEAKGFNEIPKMMETYLGKVKSFNPSEDNRKGVLLSSKTTIKQDVIQTEEHWKPNNDYEPEKVIFDRLDRNIEQINSKQ